MANTAKIVKIKITLFMIIHKMMLLKDSTILGEAISPLLEKTTKHHQK